MARRSFRRGAPSLSYRKLFVIACEGAKTEQQYFAMFQGASSNIDVRCLSSNKNKSAPLHVLARLDKYISAKGLRKGDEAWLVVDTDSWEEAHLKELYAWTATDGQYAMAVSNPKFEYWLLLHFENGAGVSSARDCVTRLKRYLPDYDKKLPTLAKLKEHIDDAIRNAKAKDVPPCSDFPRGRGSTVYRLVERLNKS